MSTERIYLNVPFNEKDIVKKLGARFDKKESKWYITTSYNPTYFRHWTTGTPYPKPDVILEGIRRNIASKCDAYSITSPFTRKNDHIAIRVSNLMHMLENNDGISKIQSQIQTSVELGLISENEQNYLNSLITDYQDYRKGVQLCA